MPDRMVIQKIGITQFSQVLVKRLSFFVIDFFIFFVKTEETNKQTEQNSNKQQQTATKNKQGQTTIIRLNKINEVENIFCQNRALRKTL
jgi:large-conductance mechanosensitive channel